MEGASDNCRLEDEGFNGSSFASMLGDEAVEDEGEVR